MGDDVLAVGDMNFVSEVLEANVPVLVDFWAPWCGPCKMITPIIADVAAEFKDRLKVVKVNVDDDADYAAKYGVKGIPCLLVFNKGELITTRTGALSKSELVAFLEDNI